MEILTSDYLDIGTVYTRTYLADLFKVTDSSKNNAIFKPKGHRSVWIWADGSSEHQDTLEGNVLHLGGQPQGGTNKLIIEHEANGIELVVFYHRTATEFEKKSNYRYLGRFRYASHVGSKPARFRLEAIDELPTGPARFAWAETNLASITPILDLAQICTEFSQSLKESHIDFGQEHDRLVRSFLSALATKRFVILTGLSGSGKTQIALRFGEWLGKNRSMVVPVRPDWTGSEALFGYEDVLQPPPLWRQAPLVCSRGTLIHADGCKRPQPALPAGTR